MRLNYIGRRTVLAMIIIVVVALVLSLRSVRAFTLEGLARTVSAYTIVDKICSTVLPVNRSEVQRVIETTLELGSKQFGLDATRKAVRLEVERRSKEVEATGVKPWCSYQKDHLSNVGLGWLFTEKR